jgi:hypothetical protein
VEGDPSVDDLMALQEERPDLTGRDLQAIEKHEPPSAERQRMRLADLDERHAFLPQRQFETGRGLPEHQRQRRERAGQRVDHEPPPSPLADTGTLADQSVIKRTAGTTRKTR